MDSASLEFVRHHNTLLNTDFVRYSVAVIAAFIVVGFLWVKRMG